MALTCYAAYSSPISTKTLMPEYQWVGLFEIASALFLSLGSLSLRFAHVSEAPNDLFQIARKCHFKLTVRTSLLNLKKTK